MEGLAAARALTDAAARRVPQATAALHEYSFATASGHDDDEIRALLRETVFPGTVRLAFEREPAAVAARTIEGDVHQIVVARARGSSRLTAMASRSVRTRFVNGRPVRVGYLGQLRIAPGYRSRHRLLKEGFEFLRRLHQEGDARVYFASVVAEHRSALKLLARRSGWPRFEAVSRFMTLAIPAKFASTRHYSTVGIVEGRACALDEILACLARNNRRFQFAPDWNEDDLTGGMPGLSLADFVTVRMDGRTVGCAALWDQRGVRQVIVRGYSRLLRTVRPILNATRAWSGLPSLPPIGARLEFGYLSHLAVDDDDPQIAAALVASIREAAARRGLEYVALGLPADAALARAIRSRFAGRTYESVLHVACWPDGEPVIASLDGRSFLPELATL